MARRQTMFKIQWHLTWNLVVIAMFGMNTHCHTDAVQGDIHLICRISLMLVANGCGNSYWSEIKCEDLLHVRLENEWPVLVLGTLVAGAISKLRLPHRKIWRSSLQLSFFEKKLEIYLASRFHWLTPVTLFQQSRIALFQFTLLKSWNIITSNWDHTCDCKPSLS